MSSPKHTELSFISDNSVVLYRNIALVWRLEGGESAAQAQTSLQTVRGRVKNSAHSGGGLSKQFQEEEVATVSG